MSFVQLQVAGGTSTYCMFVVGKKGVVSHGDLIHSCVASCLFCMVSVSSTFIRYQVPGAEMGPGNIYVLLSFLLMPRKCL